MRLTLLWQWIKGFGKTKDKKAPDLSRVMTMPTEEPSRDEAASGTEILEASQVETVELGAMAKLPPFRPVVIRLLRLFDRSDVSLEEVTALVEADPSLTSELLAIVNSPLFAIQQSVVRPAHALALLGAERTKSLAAALAMRSLMQNGPRTPVVRRFWVHSIATATIAKQIAPIFRIAAEDCYVAGLMHDLGRNGLLAAHPEPYSRLACSAHESTAGILAEEEAALGMTHCRAGALLAKAWSLPRIIQEVAALHHDAAPKRPLVALVHLSCRLADDFNYQSIHRGDIRKPEETVVEITPAHMHDRLAAALRNVDAEIDTAIKVLDF